jgi:DNA (cytosine-5)-methyltransferase 1
VSYAHHRPPPRIGSLCTGYGGLDLAVLAVLGGHVVWVADNDPAAARLLERRWPGVPNLGDITTVDWRQVPRVDVLACGWPCQDISHAGTRRGIAGPRSRLWYHVADAVGHLRPGLVFLENVAGLRTRGLEVVLAELAALRYHTSWVCLRASEVGAAHRRDRIFLLARDADPDAAHPVRV